MRIALLPLFALTLLACDEAKKAADDVANDPDVKKAVDAGKEAAAKAADAVMVTTNENQAKSAMRDILNAQAKFNEKDLDGNGMPGFWTADVAGLYCLTTQQTTKPLELIGASIAAADAEPFGKRYEFKGIEYEKERIQKWEPYFGYKFRMMEKTRDGEAYAQDAEKSGVKAKHPWAWAACAAPEKYNQTGVVTIIVNEKGILYKKDTKGKPVVKWPSEKELLEEWVRVERVGG